MSPSGGRPVDGADGAGGSRIEAKLLVHLRFDQRSKIKDAGDADAAADQVIRHIGAKGRPPGRYERGCEMSAGRVAACDQALSKAAVEMNRSLADVVNNVDDADLWAETVTRDSDGIPLGIEAGCPVAEGRGVERAPVAAVNDDDQRAALVYCIRVEEIDRLARMLPVAQTERCASGALGAIGGGVAFPPRDDLRVLRNPRAVVVFRLIIQGRRASDFLERLGSARHAYGTEEEGRYVVGKSYGA